MAAEAVAEEATAVMEARQIPVMAVAEEATAVMAEMEAIVVEEAEEAFSPPEATGVLMGPLPEAEEEEASAPEMPETEEAVHASYSTRKREIDMNYIITKDGEYVNTIVADESFVTSYCMKNGYNFSKIEDSSGTQTNIIDQAKTTKHTELSEACQSTIYNGATITLSDGSQQYFTYNDHDQTNIFEMYSAVKAGATQYIYQAQDGSCMVYQAADIITIYSTLAALKTSTLTYYHQLTDYVDTLTSVDDINAVTFGQELTGEYLERFTELITVAAEQMNIVLGITDSSEDTNNA